MGTPSETPEPTRTSDTQSGQQANGDASNRPTGSDPNPSGPAESRPDPTAEAARAGRDALVLALSGLCVLWVVASRTHLNLVALLSLAAVLGGLAMWRAITALRRAGRGRRTPGYISTLVVATLTLLISVTLGLGYLLASEVREFYDCLLGANTTTAEEACLERAQAPRGGQPTPATPPPTPTPPSRP